MSTVYILMEVERRYLECGEDSYRLAAQAPRKVYTDPAVAQARCGELNVQAWTTRQAAQHWHTYVFADEAERQSFEGDNEPEDFGWSELEWEDENPFGDETVVGEAPSHPELSYDLVEDAELAAEWNAFEALYGHRITSDTIEGESKETLAYTLATLFAALERILGAKIGSSWTALDDWQQWRVPAVTVQEANALSRFFGITFYQPVPVAIDE